MRLDPREVLALVGRAPALVEQALGLVPRASALLDAAETLLDRVDGLVDRIETTRLAANDEIAKIDATAAAADALVVRGLSMFDELVPVIERLQPIADRLSRTIDTDEVDAMVQLLDHLPELVERIETDVLPMMVTLRSVGPDVHDLLDITRELNAMLAKLPGMGRVKKRIDEEQERNAAER